MSKIDQLTSRGAYIFLPKKNNVTAKLILKNIVVITCIYQTKGPESRFSSNLTKCLNILKKQNVIDSEGKTDSGIKLKCCSLMMLRGIYLLKWKICGRLNCICCILHRNVRWDRCDHFWHPIVIYLSREHHIYIGKYI